MPRWTPELESKLLLLIIKHSDVGRDVLQKVAEEMGEDTTFEAIRQHIMKMKKKAQEPSEGPPATPQPKKRKSSEDNAQTPKKRSKGSTGKAVSAKGEDTSDIKCKEEIDGETYSVA